MNSVSPFLKRPLRSEAEARQGMTFSGFTTDELWLIRSDLEEGRDQARKAYLYFLSPPAHAPRQPPERAADMKAALERREALLDRLNDMLDETTA